MDELSLKLIIDAQNRAANELKKVNQQVQALNGSAERTAKSGFSKMGGAMSIAAGAAVTVGAAVAAAGVLIGKSAISSAMNLEQTRVAFEVMIGDAEKAKKTMADLSQFAAKTPFELPELQSAGKSLLAFGVAADQLVPTLGKIGDVSSGLNIPIGELSELYGKAKVQGRLFMEDINQLTGRGVPINQQLAKQFGVTEGKVRELVEQGKIGFPQLEQAFIDMTGPGGQFFGMMDKQSQTVAGRISTLKDGFSALTKNIIGIDPEGNIKEGGIFDQFSKSISAAGAFLEKYDEQIIAFTSGAMNGLVTYGTFVINVWKNIFEEVRKSIDQWKSYSGVIGAARKAIEPIVAFFKDQFIKSFQELKAAIQPNIPTITTFAKVVGGIVLVAIGALTVAIAAGVLAFIKIATWTQRALTAVVSFANSVKNAIAGVPGLFTTMADQIGGKINEIINRAKEWGRHMLENFAQGIREGFNPIDGAIEGAKAIFNKIAFSKNKDIPSEVWGYHMMQNFAGGIDLGNKDVKEKLDDTVAHVKKRIKDFTEGMQDIVKKTGKATSTFNKSIQEAKKTYRENIAEINKDIRSIKETMTETTASFTADLAKINSEFEKNSKSAQKGMATDVATSIVNAQDRQKEAQMGMIAELAKAEQDRNIDKITEFQKTIATEDAYLRKHAADQKTYFAEIKEVRRINGLDEIELIKEKHALEQAELQKKRDQEIADAQVAYDKKMADYAQELVDLKTQKNKELEIYQDAQTRAQNILKKSLEKQKQDTKAIVGEMVKEFDRIPAGFSNAFNALGKKMVNAGNAISGKDSKGKSTTNNNKNFSITIQGGAGESQADLLKRLSVLLKTV